MAKKNEDVVVAPVEAAKEVAKPVAPVEQVVIKASVQEELDALMKYLGVRVKLDAGKVLIVK